MNWLSVVWLASFVVVADVASGCSGSSAGASGPTSLSCGHLAGPCCPGEICASGLACQGALCTPIEAVGGSPDSGAERGDGMAALNAAGCVPVPSGLVSWWTGDGDARDSVGPNGGTPAGSVTYVGGVVGQAFHFASDSYVSASTIGLPTGASDRTIEGWVRFESQYAGGTQGLIFGYGTWGSASQSVELLVNGNGTSVDDLTFSQWGDAVAAPGQSQQGTWYHFATVLSGTTTRLYVNGTLVSMGTIPVNTPAGTIAYLGGNPDVPMFTEWLDGDVDELSVYSRALSAAEVGAIYGSGQAGKCKGSGGAVSASDAGGGTGSGSLACSMRAVPAELTVGTPGGMSCSQNAIPCGTTTASNGGELETCCCAKTYECVMPQSSGCGYCRPPILGQQGAISCGYGSDGTPWFCPLTDTCIPGSMVNPNNDFNCCPQGESCGLTLCP